MSQLRLDPLTGRWVVISGDRAGRPAGFLSGVLPVESGPPRPCPFCPGNEDATPPALESYGSERPVAGAGGAQQVPGVRGATSRWWSATSGPVYTQAPASGIHEVFILTPDHDASWADLTEAHAGLVMAALRDRMVEHAAIPGLRYSQAVVNRGREAGASLHHPHGQLLSMPFVPGETASEMAGFARFQGNCLLCAAVDAEEEAKHRIVHTDDRVVALAPFWSGSPYEMLIIPRHHGPHLFRAGLEDLVGVGSSIQRALAVLRSRLGEVPYNIMFHSAPYRLSGDYHWHVHIVPKVTTPGGFELGSGVLINVVPPERPPPSCAPGSALWPDPGPPLRAAAPVPGLGDDPRGPLAPVQGPVHDPVVPRHRGPGAADDLDHVADLAEVVERLRVVRSEVDAAVGDVGATLGPLGPRCVVDVLAAVTDVDVVVDVLVVAAGALGGDPDRRRHHVHDRFLVHGDVDPVLGRVPRSTRR